MQLISEVRVQRYMSGSTSVSDLRSLVLKLRWIGLDTEAESLGEELVEMVPAICPLIGPRETD